MDSCLPEVLDVSVIAIFELENISLIMFSSAAFSQNEKKISKPFDEI